MVDSQREAGKAARPSRSSPLRVADPTDDPRPVVRLGPELHESVAKAVAALADDPDLYQRDGSLVRVTYPAGDGAPVIRPHVVATLRPRLTAFARFEKFDAKNEEWSRCIPPDPVSYGVLAQAQWDGLRPLVGVLEAPTFREDGGIIEIPGYDAATGYVYAPTIEFPPVPLRPSQGAAARALAQLEEVFADFPYRSPADRAAVLAAALTLLARPAISGACPAFLVDATTPGSGKTLQADVVAILATGRTTAKMAFPVDDDEETEKILGGYALEGAQIVAFDNIAGAFGGGPIDKVLTADDLVKLRILGQSSVPAVRWRAIIFGTGNNITWRGDTHRRVLIPKLEPAVENPEERVGFAHPDLRGWVRAERPRLVAAALTILRAFHVAGRPALGCKVWGSFEAWSELIPRALVFAGAADPMGCRPAADVDARDEERINIITVFGALGRLQGSDGITARAMVDLLYTADRMRGEAAPDGHEEAREAIEALTRTAGGKRPDARKLGDVLKRWKRRPVGGRRVDVAGTDRNKVARWLVV